MTRVSLDTNILVYALHVDDHRNARAVEIIARAADSECIQTLQSYAECFNALVNRRGFSPEVAREEIRRFRSTLDCVAPRPADFDEAMQVVIDHQISFWDAMLWAAARRAGCTLILTEDFQNLRNLEGVQFVNPFDPANDALVDRVLALTES
jgi:predicted nucleic acid-binding protein